MHPILYLYTDFGVGSIYVGQLHGMIAQHLPQIQTVDLCHELEPCQVRPAAYLLAALIPFLAIPAVVVGVVDPGVGTARAPILIRGEKLSLIGPDNGLFSLVSRQFPGRVFQLAKIGSRALSASFHGRDLFVPWAIRLLTDSEDKLESEMEPLMQPIVGSDWPQQIQEVIHIDRFGNAMTAWVAKEANHNRSLQIGSHTLAYRSTFGEAIHGTAFWYVNSLGLIEIACNQKSASDTLGIHVGDSFVWL
ncbi:MAG: SAM hydrolase/SAM-dependent halogenase family protein [Gammaproteobacteria bacterium]